ncbi:ATPase [Paenibacillus sp. BIHB 4019]|uniref:ATPase n=1 Tax=Paenibacillus sp. BIHB 4019 TaxID=1870819 RepID=A0A1B2DIB8_9BACL|nr:ATP-binding protein [Paenibacillus sp. BIHB 4019]ANY67462.1 ATPase [Paenibacillus sp. BIHB 4019]
MITKTYKPYIFKAEAGQSTDDYFNYATAVQTIKNMLEEAFDSPMQLYMQDDGDDVWDWVSDDLASGYEGVKREAAIYDLVEDRSFRFEDSKSEANYRINPSLRNNVITYPEFEVAFARIPFLRQYGLNTEDIIFAKNDETMRAFLEAMQARQLSERRVTIFTDTKEGFERSKEQITRMVERDEVMMSDSLKQQIYRSIDEFFSRDREFFQTYNVPYKRGILLYGKPGNGKTTLVKSIAGSVEAPVAYWQITEYTTSDSIQQVFSAAMKMAPMILVIEDIDSMPDSARSFFLNTLDGATSREGLFLIGTTNYPEKIDPALMNRAGRFDRAYEMKLPDQELRLAYLQRKGFGRLAEEADGLMEDAAKFTEGFSFAQLNELYVSAALQKHYEQSVDLKRVIEELKTDFDKDRRGVWMADKGQKPVGFQPL